MKYRSEFAVFAAGQATFGIVETGAAHARKNIVKVALRGSTTSERERVTTNSPLSTVRFARLQKTTFDKSFVNTKTRENSEE